MAVVLQKVMHITSVALTMRIIRLVLTIVAALPGVELSESQSYGITEKAHVFESCINGNCTSEWSNYVAGPLITVWVLFVLRWVVYFFFVKRNEFASDHVLFGTRYKHEQMVDLTFEFIISVALLTGVALADHHWNKPGVTLGAGFNLLVSAVVLSWLTFIVYAVAHAGNPDMVPAVIDRDSKQRAYLQPSVLASTQDNCNHASTSLRPGERDWAMRV